MIRYQPDSDSKAQPWQLSQQPMIFGNLLQTQGSWLEVLCIICFTRQLITDVVAGLVGKGPCFTYFTASLWKQRAGLSGTVNSSHVDTCCWFGGFLKWGYPEIIHFQNVHRFSIINHPFWGTAMAMETSTCSWLCWFLEAHLCKARTPLPLATQSKMALQAEAFRMPMGVHFNRAYYGNTTTLFFQHRKNEEKCTKYGKHDDQPSYFVGVAHFQTSLLRLMLRFAKGSTSCTVVLPQSCTVTWNRVVLR